MKRSARSVPTVTASSLEAVPPLRPAGARLGTTGLIRTSIDVNSGKITLAKSTYHTGHARVISDTARRRER